MPWFGLLDRMMATVREVRAREIQCQELEVFLSSWSEEYRTQAQKVRLFTADSAEVRGWSACQKKMFAGLFYHARGHFHQFLWHLANQGSHEQRAVLFENIRDELGVAPYSPHEILYARFASEFGINIQAEIFGESERWDLHFLRGFNEGHLRFIFTHEQDANWALFSAYELLDNVDYVNLLNLARAMGANDPKTLEFFEVHVRSDHHAQTQKLLRDVWIHNSEAVREAFEFIAKHQLSMWQGISFTIMPYAPS